MFCGVIVYKLIPDWSARMQKNALIRHGSTVRSCLLDLSESAVHDVRLRLAFVFGEVCKKLLFGFVGIGNEFLAGSESQPAYVAVGDARSSAHEADDLHVSFRHEIMIAGQADPVKSAEGRTAPSNPSEFLHPESFLFRCPVRISRE